MPLADCKQFGFSCHGCRNVPTVRNFYLTPSAINGRFLSHTRTIQVQTHKAAPSWCLPMKVIL